MYIELASSHETYAHIITYVWYVRSIKKGRMGEKEKLSYKKNTSPILNQRQNCNNIVMFLNTLQPIFFLLSFPFGHMYEVRVRV